MNEITSRVSSPLGARIGRPLEAFTVRLLLGFTLITGADLAQLRGQEPDSAEALPVATNTEAVQLASDFVDAFSQQAMLTAEKKYLERSSKSPGGRGQNAEILRLLAQLPVKQRQMLTTLLTENLQRFDEEVDRILQAASGRSTAMQQSWKAIRALRNEADAELAEAKASQQAAGQFASIVSLDNRWFWLSACLAFVSLVFVVWHEQRHEYRKRLNGGYAKSLRMASILQGLMIALACLALVVFFFGGWIYDLMLGTASVDTRSAVTIREEVAQIQQSTESLAAMLPALRQQAAAAEGEQLGGTERRKTRAKVLGLVIVLVAIEEIAQSMRDDTEKLEQFAQDKRKYADSLRALHTKKRLYRSGMGLSLFGIVCFGSVMFLRGVNRRNRELADTCPLCLSKGALQAENDASGRRSARLAKVRCTSVLDEDAYKECDFSFLSIYRDMPKLCFPTIGHPSAGKTHWLAMAYREINQGGCESARFQKIKSDRSEDFDRLVDEIINVRLDPAATQPDIPYPLLFNLRDRDPWGRSSVLLNIFDYSGEVVQRMTLEDSQRRRMLEADGYLFFLDPTKPAEEQAKELVDFSEDVQIIKQIRSGGSVRVPVALCVSKIDLLVNQPYASPSGGDEVARFYQDVTKFDTGKRISRASIEARSKLMTELRHTIWPGWQIEQQIDQLFGGRHMYFPMTPVGLNELGETNLSNRVIDPRWILEPLLWLLDMNGYPVLDK